MSASARTHRGRFGKKWVGLNFQEKETAKENNGGTMPFTLSLITSNFPRCAEWSEIDLPDILFYIHPPASEYEGVKVEYLIQEGKPVLSDAPDKHKIRDFRILPRNISLDVPGWLIEAWRRLDTRIGYQDILDRQRADLDLGLKKHSKNALQNHCRRECRKVLNTWVEYGRRDEPHRTDVEAIEGLSYENVMLNTTLKRSEIFPNRLVKVRIERRVEDGLYYAIPREVTAENWLETTLPLDHFLPASQNSQPLEMTTKMNAAWETYLALMERAAAHGHSHWSKLDRSCLPITWYDRTTVKTVPNDTYDGGCDVCTWRSDAAITASTEIKRELVKSSPKLTSSKRRRSGSSAAVRKVTTIPNAGLETLPDYLPASVFPNRLSAGVAVSTQEDDSVYSPCESSMTLTPHTTSFSSTNGSSFAVESSFSEESRTTPDDYLAPATPVDMGFPVAQFYPLPMTRPDTMMNGLSYHSTPYKVTYHNQMTFNSSPPPHSNAEWELDDGRPRRYSEADLAFGIPDDFAQIGAFEYDLSTLTSYLDEKESVDAPSPNVISPDEEFTVFFDSADDNYITSDAAVAGEVGEDTPTKKIAGTTFDDLLAEQTSPAAAAPAVFQG